MRAPIVSTTAGPIKGTRDNGISAFKGIPFGHAARFARATSPAPWHEPLECTTFGDAPVQNRSEWVPTGTTFSENCLNLNVWAPDGGNQQLPVMVWIYGGGFEGGLSGVDDFDGQELARAGMVIVTINYRVGALGFATLAHEGQGLEETSNLGLSDIVLALEWVKANIAAFGGKASAVTVAGSSAGAFLAASLPAVTGASGLYSQLALFSGGASRLVPQETARRIGSNFRKQLGQDPVVSSWDKIVQSQQLVVSTNIGSRNSVKPEAFGVVLDNEEPNGLLSMHPLEAYAQGTAADITIWVSGAFDEISPFRQADPQFDPCDVQAFLDQRHEWGVDGERAETLVQSYLSASDDLGVAKERLLTDWIYLLPAARLVETQTAAGGIGYLSLTGRAGKKQAIHGCETPGLFAHHLDVPDEKERQRSEEIARSMVAFVKTGNPGWAHGVSDAHTFGDRPLNATNTYESVLDRWAGVARP